MRKTLAFTVVLVSGAVAGCGDNLSQPSDLASPDLTQDSSIPHPDLSDASTPRDLTDATVVDLTVPPDLTDATAPPDLTDATPAPDLTDATPPPDMAKPLFKDQVVVQVQNNPGAIAAGDFNEDGKQDLVVSSISDGSIVVLFGDGRGAFQPFVRYPVTKAGAMATGDFNGDGHLDVAVAEFQNIVNVGSSVQIMNGSANGALTAGTVQATNGFPTALVAVDLDGDTRVDLAVSSGVALNNINLQVFAGQAAVQGQAKFGAPLNIALPGGPRDCTAASIAKGGKLPDLACVTVVNGLSYIKNTGALNAIAFAAPINFGAAGLATSIAAGDFDHDGAVDLLVTDAKTGNLDIYYNDQMTPFPNVPVHLAVAKTPSATALADFNGDTFLDISTADSTSNELLVMRRTAGNPRAYDPTLKFPVGRQPYGLKVADFNGDARPDVAATATGGSTVSILLNQW